MSKILKTNDLVSIVRLRGMLPQQDVTFSDTNIISLLNEEMDVFGVTQLLKLSEGYLVYSEDIAIVEDQTQYIIPYRSIGNKCKEIQIVDSSLNVHETSQIELSQVTDFQSVDFRSTFSGRDSIIFYVKNNYIIFPNGFPVTTGYIRVSFYLRPNKLVPNNQGAIISAINTTTGVITVSNFPTAFLTAPLMDFVAVRSPNKIYNYDVQPGVVSSTALTVQFAVEKDLTSVAFATDIITLTSHGYYTGMITTFSSTLTLPGGLSSGTTYYLIKIDADTFKVASSLANALAGTAINLTDDGTGTITATPTLTHLHSELAVGDFICLAEESIVPQLPTELHPVLAQRVAALCVDALEGTPDRLQKRVREMEIATNTLISNRVEDAPRKITQRKGLLR